MSICPKNKSSKGKRDKRRANWINDCSNIGKVQQMRRINDASQSLQKLRFLQQERNHSAGLMNVWKEARYLTVSGIWFFVCCLYVKNRKK